MSFDRIVPIKQIKGRWPIAVSRQGGNVEVRLEPDAATEPFLAYIKGPSYFTSAPSGYAYGWYEVVPDANGNWIKYVNGRSGIAKVGAMGAPDEVANPAFEVRGRDDINHGDTTGNALSGPYWFHPGYRDAAGTGQHYLFAAGEKSGTAAITVKNLNGSNACVGVHGITTDTATGITVTFPGGMDPAPISLIAASGSQWGVVTDTTQSFQGDKHFLASVYVGNNLTVNGSATIGTTLDVGGAATFGSTIDATGDITSSAHIGGVAGGVTTTFDVGTDLTVGGDATVDGDGTVAGNMAVGVFGNPPVILTVYGSTVTNVLEVDGFILVGPGGTDIGQTTVVDFTKPGGATGHLHFTLGVLVNVT